MQARARGPRTSARAGPPRWYGLALSAGLIALGSAGTLIGGAGQVGAARIDSAKIGPAVAAIASPGAATTKFYVVGGSVNGQREYLFAIAAKTLGNGNRYVEIFKLNQGRRQPDGRRMEDPTVVEPGWVLLLPPDAKGAGVRVGPLPSTLSASAGDPRSAPPHHGAHDAPQHAAQDSDGAVDGVVRTAGLVAMVILMGWALWMLRRGTRLSLPLSSRTALVPLAPATRASELGEAVVGAAVTPDAQVRPDTSPSESRRTDIETPDARPSPKRTEATTASRRPAVLRAEVVSGRDAMSVRLAGVRAASEPAPLGWVYAAEPPYGGAALAALGENARGTLYVDIALTPDVITITGSRAARQRQALSLARQLVGVGVAVTVVGDPFGSPAAGCRFLPTVEDAVREATSARVGLRVIFCDDANDADLRTIRKAVAAAMPRLVPVLVGDVRRARWTIHVQPMSDPPIPTAARPASKRATGTQNGAQDT